MLRSFNKRKQHHLRSSIFMLPEWHTRKMLSFCITHWNRFNQIKQTLRQNLDDNREDRHSVEFVLIDFDSTEADMRTWILSEFRDELKDGYLNFYQSSDLHQEWYPARAKNTAHLLGQGKILVNLDCDNFVGPRGGRRVYEPMTRHKEGIFYWQYSQRGHGDGTFGRIGMTADIFHILGGYDEALLKYLHEDTDLLRRLDALGLRCIADDDPAYCRAIWNPRTYDEKKWRSLNSQNRDRSIANVRKGILRANAGKVWGIRDGLKRLDPHTGEMESVNLETLLSLP